MFGPLSRRRFVTASSAAALAGLGDFSFLSGLPSLEAAAAPVEKRGVAVADDVEPLVRLLEDSPREKVIERVVEKIKGGTTYNELLSALMLAGVRGIQPRPVGFKFHAVLVVNSAHLASLAAEDRDRWLPMLWAVDYFKGAQATNTKEGDWRMGGVPERNVPAAHLARRRFAEALDAWDEDAADAAIVGLGRGEGAAGVFEQLWKYGARDFRDIGHKAIYVANAWRTLQTIGWRHHEPILRSLAFALLDRGRGENQNPAKADLAPDRPGRANLPRAAKLDKKLIAGKKDGKVSVELLETLRTANAEDASKAVEGFLTKDVHPSSIWDGLFLTAGELLMRQPGIVGLHTLTTVNAMHFGYHTSAEPTTRAFLLLQAAAFLTLFRDALPGRGKVGTDKLDKLEKADLTKDPIDDILADVSKDRMRAARKTLALIESDPSKARPLMHHARRMVFAKGTDSHDYKFSSAVLEDYHAVVPALRPRFLAASMFYLKGSRDRDNTLIGRAREALRG